MSDFSFEEALGQPTTPAAPAASKGWRVTPEEQATRDQERMRILQREATDPNLPGGDSSRAAVEREISRAGGKVVAREPEGFSFDEGLLPGNTNGDSEGSLFNRVMYGRDKAPEYANSVGSYAAHVGKETLKNFASLADMFNGLPHQGLALMSDLNTRLAGLVQGKPHAEVSKEAEARVQEIMGAAPKQITQLTAALLGSGETAGVDQVMGTVDSWFDEKGAQLQKATGGALRREDVKSLVNAAFTAAGATGVKAAAGTKITNMRERAKAEGLPEKLTPEEVVAERAKPEPTPEQVQGASRAAAFAEARQNKVYVRPGQRGAVDMNALIPKESEGLTGDQLRALATLSLGSLLKASDYTTKTLDRLPQNRTEFTKQMIEEQLKRPDVTAAEKGVFAEILATSGDKISAHELMARFKQETGDWELKPKQTDEFADYGLERIGREAEGGMDPDALADLSPEDRATALQEAGNLQPRTSVYRLPPNMSFGTGNHFSDPRYFAHTRSFVENGTRHVVEMQSDLAQNTKGAVRSEDRIPLLDRNEVLQKQIDKHGDLLDALDARLDQLPYKPDDPIRKGLDERRRTLWADRAQAKVEAREIRAKLEATEINSRLSPILKNWPKRVIREELGQAAEAGEKSVRFATGDTVAKVEGWPNAASALKEDIKYLEKNIASEEQQFERNGLSARGYGGIDIRTSLSQWKYRLEDAKQRLAELKDSEHLRPEHAGIKKHYDTDIAKFLKQLGGKEVTDTQGHTWIEVPVAEAPNRRAGQRQMFGRADTELLTKLGLGTAGAAAGLYLADDNKKMAGVMGGLVGLLLAGKAGAQAVKGADYGLGLISTRIRNKSESLLKRGRDYERQLRRNAHDKIETAAPFLKELNNLKGADAAAVDLALTSNNKAALQSALTRNPQLAKSWSAVDQLIKTEGRALIRAGLVKNLRSDYLFPRVVIDRPGLVEKLGGVAKEGLERKLAEAEAKTGQALSPVEESTIINQYLRRLDTSDYAPGFTKGRKIAEVTADLRPFYAAPGEALHQYLSATTRAIEKAKFFGRDLVREGEGGRVDTNASIGELVRRERERGKLTAADEVELREMLQSRFGAGERGASPLIQTVKNLTNAGLLGNIVSAGTQLSDLGSVFYAHGIRPTLEALTQKLAGTQRLSARELGLLGHISEELISTGRDPKFLKKFPPKVAAKLAPLFNSAKFVESTFKWSGFQALDGLAKDVHLNAPLIKYQRLLKTAKGERELSAKYKEAFGEEYPQLEADLKAGKVTENTRSLSFSELSDFQPTSKLEMPQGYNDMPNGRLVYMLRSFVLKQADIVRRDAYNNIKKGLQTKDYRQVAKGFNNLLKFSLTMGISGATVAMLTDWISGRKVDFKDLDIAGNLLKTFGWSRWVMDKMRTGDWNDAVLSLTVPPFQMWADITKRDPKAVRYIPILGKLLYSHEMGGAEKADAAEEKAARLTERTPEEKAEARERAAKRKQGGGL